MPHKTSDINLLWILPIVGSVKNLEKEGTLIRVIRELRFLKKKFKKIYFISKDFETLDIGKGIEHHHIPIKVPAFLQNLLFLFNPLFIHKPYRVSGIYYVDHVSGCFPAVLAKLLYRKKIIVRYDWSWSEFARKDYSYPTYLAISFFEKISLKSADVIIVTTPTLRNKVQEIIKINKKTILIDNWTDTKIFSPSKKRTYKKYITIISVGRLWPQKNFQLILKAINLLDNKIKSRIRLLIIGSGFEEENLKRSAAEYHINLTIKKGVPNRKVAKLLKDSDVFISSSKYEGQPRVIIEAMSCGLPIIATNIPGNNELIKNNDTGLLIDIDEKNLAEKLEKLLSAPKLRKKLGENSRRYAAKRFSFQKVMSEIYGTIQKNI